MFYNQSENEVGKPGAETSGKVEGGETYADCHDGAFLAPSGSLLKASNPDPETIRATFSDMATVAQSPAPRCFALNHRPEARASSFSLAHTHTPFPSRFSHAPFL